MDPQGRSGQVRNISPTPGFDPRTDQTSGKFEELVFIVRSPHRPAHIMDPFSALVILKYPPEYNSFTLKM